MKLETIAFAISFLSFCGGVLAAVWRVSASVSEMKNSLQSYIKETCYDLEKKDLRLENLQDRLVLGFNGLREKFEHFSNRYRSEVREVNARLEDIEEFLAKTTEFARRK